MGEIADEANKLMGKVEDKTSEVIDDKDTPAGGDTKAEPKGYEKDPKYKVAAQTKEFLDDVLEDYGLESPEDLRVFIDNLSQMRGKIADKNLDELIEKSNTLDRYQAYWADQEETKRREEEEPDETIKRLEKQLREERTRQDHEEQAQQERKQAEKAVKEYNSEIRSFLSKQDHIPKEYIPFVSKYMGVDNPSNEVDLDNKIAIRKMSKQLLKDFEAFEQTVIKRYRDGKIEIPKVTSTDQAEPGRDTKPEFKTIKESKIGARKFIENFIRSKS